MINDPVLINDWHPVASVEELKIKNLLGTRLLGEDIVVWRVNGQPLAWQDLCIHRGTRLSMGRVEDDNLHCPYHGWVYDEAGQCVKIPAHPDQVPPVKARVKTYQAREQYGLVWVSLGKPEHGIPTFSEWDQAAYRKILWLLKTSWMWLISHLCTRGSWVNPSIPKLGITKPLLNRTELQPKESACGSLIRTALVKVLPLHTRTGFSVL